MPPDRMLVCEVGGAKLVVWGEPLDWLAEKGGYASVDDMIRDPHARDRFSVEQLVFAQEQSFGREARRRMR
jgi:hypothetical protein